MHYLCTYNTKWRSLISSHFAINIFFLHVTSSCPCSIYLYFYVVSGSFRLWCKKFSPCMHHLSKTKPLLRSKVQKALNFVKNYFLRIKLLHANVQGVYIVYTVSDCFSKSCGNCELISLHVNYQCTKKKKKKKKRKHTHTHNNNWSKYPERHE